MVRLKNLFATGVLLYSVNIICHGAFAVNYFFKESRLSNELYPKESALSVEFRELEGDEERLGLSFSEKNRRDDEVRNKSIDQAVKQRELLLASCKFEKHVKRAFTVFDFSKEKCE